jgi:hypothetical protein
MLKSCSDTLLIADNPTLFSLCSLLRFAANKVRMVFYFHFFSGVRVAGEEMELTKISELL